MIRILIADDHALVRRGLGQLFALEADLEVAGEAQHGQDVLNSLRESSFDLLVMDLSMPGLSGLDLIHRVHVQNPSLPIVVLSMHDEQQLVSRVLRAGAAAYVTKDSDPEILLSAVRKVARGGRFIDPRLVDALVFGGEAAEQAPHELLSDREYEILQLIAQGLSLEDIGLKLSISAKTVSTHKTRLMQKVGLGNNAELLRYAIRHGLAKA